MRLILIRHGATKANIERRFQGTIDYPLCDAGLKQADYLGKRIEDVYISKIYTSYLRRAKETAETIAHYKPECEIEVLHDLKEYSWGIIEGLTREEISHKYYELAVQMEKDFWGTEIPGEEGMKSLKNRLAYIYDLITGRHLQGGEKENFGDKKTESVAIVSHGRVIGGFLAYITGYDIYDFPWPFVFSNASLTEVKFLYYNGKIKPRIILLNDTCHIKDLDKGISY